MNSLTLGASKIKSKKVADTTFWTLQKKLLAIKLTSVFLVIAILFGGTWKIAKAYEGKILPKVTIAGLKIGGKTPSEAKTIVKNYVNKVNNQGPQISYDTQNINPKLDEMGLTFNVDQVVHDAYRYGRNGSIKNRVKENAQIAIKNYSISLNPKIDEKKFDEYLGQLAQVVEIAPQNASLTITNGNINLQPSKVGRGLDKDKLKNDLTNLIDQDKLNSQIALITSDIQPKILDEGTVQAQEDAAKLMAAAPITVTFEDLNFVADKSEIGSWIGFTEDNDHLNAMLSSGKVAAFAEEIGSKIEINKVDREIMDGTGEVLNEGQDGRGVDKNLLSNDLYNKVISGGTGLISVATFPIPKGEVVKNPHAQPGRHTGRYIDVNLSEQTLYAFEGTKLVNQFLVSTGKTGPTPTGEFSVYGKTRSQTMDGPGYSLPNVEWISWWSGDYSIHGTYWHNNFGNPMSHGCINASNGDAEWIYNWDDIGTPVYIHW